MQGKISKRCEGGREGGSQYSPIRELTIRRVRDTDSSKNY